MFEPFWKGTKSTRRLIVRDDIVITNVDKEGLLVILDVKDYVKDC